MTAKFIVYISICFFICAFKGIGPDRFTSKNIKGKNYEGVVSLEKLQHRTGYRLFFHNNLTNAKEQLYIKYPVYRFDVADVNGDGNTDVLLGVIKGTRFDKRPNRRLSILQIDSNKFRPLWLGSRLCMKLIDFRAGVVSGKTTIKTLEKNAKGGFSVGLYEWESFGLSLIKYTHSGADYDSLYQIFTR
jgi:hypothetical protein